MMSPGFLIGHGEAEEGLQGELVGVDLLWCLHGILPLAHHVPPVEVGRVGWIAGMAGVGWCGRVHAVILTVAGWDREL